MLAGVGFLNEYFYKDGRKWDFTGDGTRLVGRCSKIY